jgi:hypothetical protein
MAGGNTLSLRPLQVCINRAQVVSKSERHGRRRMARTSSTTSSFSIGFSKKFFRCTNEG